jgi:hypothetical protein
MTYRTASYPTPSVSSAAMARDTAGSLYIYVSWSKWPNLPHSGCLHFDARDNRGFQHSRRSDHASEGPSQVSSHRHYHHLRRIGQRYGNERRFLPSCDFYSLGILLLEIGYWRTLAAITADLGLHRWDFRQQWAILQTHSRGRSLETPFCHGFKVRRYCRANVEPVQLVGRKGLERKC